jgi:putative transposase
LPKIGDVPVRWSRPLPSAPSSVTVIKDAANRYFASFVIQVEPAPLPEAGSVIGIDLGLTHFAVLSDGRKIASPRFLRRAEKKLRHAQKCLPRKEKGSKNREKARVKVARAYSRVVDARRNFHHQLSTALIRENQADAPPDKLRAMGGVPVIRYRLPAGAPQLPAGLAEHVAGGELTLPSADVTADLALLTGWARGNHVDLTGLEVGSPSLEDAYLALTSEERVLNHG